MYVCMYVGEGRGDGENEEGAYLLSLPEGWTLIRAYAVNPSTPTGDHYRISPYNINKLTR